MLLLTLVWCPQDRLTGQWIFLLSKWFATELLGHLLHFLFFFVRVIKHVVEANQHSWLAWGFSWDLFMCHCADRSKEQKLPHQNSPFQKLFGRWLSRMHLGWDAGCAFLEEKCPLRSSALLSLCPWCIYAIVKAGCKLVQVLLFKTCNPTMCT